MFDKKLERTILKRGCRTVYAHITSKLIAIAQVQIKLQILEELTDFLLERSDRKQQQQSTFYTFITQFHSFSPTHPYCTLFTSSTSIFDAPVPVSPRNKSGRSSQLARPTVPATVSKSAETPYIHIIEEEKHFLWARFKGHTLLYTFTPYTNVWEIYKVTDRRRAHVQFPWNIHENKPLSRRRETSSRVSCGLAQGRRRP